MIESNEIAKFDGKKIGQRIKACRVLSGLNQEEFCRRHEISLQSLKTWELGVVPRSEGCAKLVESFCRDGVFINHDWLIFGMGTGPTFNLQDACNVKHFDDIIDHFIKSCQKTNGNPITVEIEDNAMTPLFGRGDLVLGTMVLFDSICKEGTHDGANLFMIKLSSGKFAPRWLHFYDDNVFARSNASTDLERIVSPTIAKIIWHRRA